MKRTWVIITSLTIVLAASILYWAFYSPEKKISNRIYQTIKEQEKRADLSFKDVTFEEVLSGIKYWDLSSKTAMVNKSSGLATLKNAEGTFFKDGKAVLRFKAPAALWDMAKKEILLDKPLGYDISLENKISSLIESLKKRRFSIFHLPEIYKKGTGYWFQANNLSWKLENQKLLCSGGIVLNKGETTGYSEKLEGDVALESVTIKGNPKIVIKPEQSSPLTLEADLFTIISPEDTILAQGSPALTWKEAKITADKIKYLQKEKILFLDGNVNINYKDIKATGQKAVYLTKEESIELAGNAQAKQGGNNLKGEKVRISLKDKKISVLGKGKVVIIEEGLKKP